MTSPTPSALTTTEKLEDEASIAGEVAAGALDAIEIGAVVLIGLLICPPLAILTVVVVVPLLLIGLVLGLLVAIVTAPYLLVQHFRGHDRRHLPLLKQRLRHAGRALLDVLPHRIVRDARHEG